jgi:hypothetical protein
MNCRRAAPADLMVPREKTGRFHSEARDSRFHSQHPPKIRRFSSLRFISVCSISCGSSTFLPVLAREQLSVESQIVGSVRPRPPSFSVQMTVGGSAAQRSSIRQGVSRFPRHFSNQVSLRSQYRFEKAESPNRRYPAMAWDFTLICFAVRQRPWL